MSDNPIKCIVIDDEPLAVSLFEAYITKTSFLKYMGGFTNAAQAKEIISEGEVELIFSDIQMPGLSGIELAQIIPEKCSIVFVTAYDCYALKGFQVNALDYLLKPVSYQDFLKSCNKIRRYLRPAVVANNDGESIRVRADRQDLFINVSDIYIVEALKDYMLLRTKEGNVITNCTLKQLKSQLPESLFIQVHRSYIVNKRKISAISSSFVTVQNKEIPISNTYRADIKNWLDKDPLNGIC